MKISIQNITNFPIATLINQFSTNPDTNVKIIWAISTIYQKTSINNISIIIKSKLKVIKD